MVPTKDCVFFWDLSASGLQPFVISSGVYIDPWFIRAYLRWSLELILPWVLLIAGRLTPLGVGWLVEWPRYLKSSIELTRLRGSLAI
ncbi:hypothetical protein KY289_027901 [Solanum tuberosum]|nr:hypothetical protein KY289_027901 [Solanum tuberosum]KAH0662767.1 hypothetical protein KY284_027698 [Solanum tuberosum]